MSSQDGHGAASDDELDPDEPRTPLWLPLVGLCLFVAGLIYFLAGQKPAPAEAAPAATASAAPSAPVPAPPH